MSSKGEQKIAQLLRQDGIKYKQEVEFEGLKGSKGLLRYDFGIYRQNQLLLLLEYDGIQHFCYTSYFHKSQIGFRRQKEHDIKKNKYCLFHHIPLIRIPYWELDNLTLQKIFNTPSFVVHTATHNINLIDKYRGVKWK